jgi:hypothetical protein
LSEQIHRTQPFQQFTEPTEPWNIPARVKVVFYSCIGVGGIGMGITNYVTILQSSGYTLFEQLMRCVIFVFVCALFPVLLELGLGRLKNDSYKKIYLNALWLIGIGAGLSWAILFARIIPSLNQSPASIIGSLSLHEAQTDVGNNQANWLVFCAMVCEACVAALCWHAIEELCRKHRPPKLQDNPVHQSIQAKIDHYHMLKSQLADIRDKVIGRLQELEIANERFVDQAVVHYRTTFNAVQQGKKIGSIL